MNWYVIWSIIQYTWGFWRLMATASPKLLGTYLACTQAMLDNMCRWGKIQRWFRSSWTSLSRPMTITLQQTLENRAGCTLLRSNGWAVWPCMLGVLWQRFEEVRASWSDQSYFLRVRSECTQLLCHPRILLSSIKDFPYSSRWAGTSVAWDMGSVKSPNGFSTVWRVFPVRRGAQAVGEARSLSI